MHIPREQLGWAFYAAGMTLLLTALLIKSERHGKRTASVGLTLLVAAVFIGGWWPWWPAR